MERLKAEKELIDKNTELERQIKENGMRRAHAKKPVYQQDKYFKELVLFYEYFHGDTARGVGASHQTGWTGVVAELINRISLFEKTKKKIAVKEEAPA